MKPFSLLNVQLSRLSFRTLQRSRFSPFELFLRNRVLRSNHYMKPFSWRWEAAAAAKAGQTREANDPQTGRQNPFLEPTVLRLHRRNPNRDPGQAGAVRVALHRPPRHCCE